MDLPSAALVPGDAPAKLTIGLRFRRGPARPNGTERRCRMMASATPDGTTPSRGGGAQPRRGVPRLVREILEAFDHACAQGEEQVATELLRTAERIAVRPRTGTAAFDPRRTMEAIVAAHGRLWVLRRPGCESRRGAQPMTAADRRPD